MVVRRVDVATTAIQRVRMSAVSLVKVRRTDLLALRFRRHDLHREPGSLAAAGDVAILDLGVQDTGADGALWALANRGAPPPRAHELVYAWTLRGAPHAYRRADVREVVRATAPFSEADAAKRIFDAARPLRAAGIPVLEALREVARKLRDIVTAPTVKGEVSSRLTEVLDEPYLRSCRPCNAIHSYEMTFRLAPLQAGLELEPGTSPPVLRRIARLRPALYQQLADTADARFAVVRGHLRWYPGASVADVASYLDAPRKEVEANWPEDAVDIEVIGMPRGAKPLRGSALAGDVEELGNGPPTGTARTVRLLGSHDPFLQLRDRAALVADAGRQRALWPVLGRPGAVVADGEVLGTWRPRTTSGRLTVRLDPWDRLTKGDRTAIEQEAEMLAAHRGVALAGVVED